jgi:hypothetical protein
MTEREKITEYTTWAVSATITVEGTYREALSYLCYLRYTYGGIGYYLKPLLLYV